MSKKGILIVPVEIVEAAGSGGGSGCGAIISGILIIIFIGWILLSAKDHKDNQVISNPATVVPQPSVSIADTNSSVVLNQHSSSVQTVGRIPKMTNGYENNIQWIWSNELRLIAVTYDWWGSGDVYLVFNQSGQIASINLNGTERRYIGTISLDANELRYTLWTKPDVIAVPYSNQRHINPTAPYVHIEMERIVNGLVDGDETYDQMLIWQSGASTPINQCEILSARETGFLSNGNFISYNLDETETGFFAAYDGHSVRLWSLDCREIFNYQTTNVITHWEQGLIITNEGGVLFVEEAQEEYLIRYVVIR